MNKINLKYLIYLLAVSIALYLFINMYMLINSSKTEAFSIIRPMEMKQVSTNQISFTCLKDLLLRVLTKSTLD